jgi:hypothetical protein
MGSTTSYRLLLGTCRNCRTSAAPVEDDDSNLRADYFRNFIDPALSAHEPASDVVYPIFDNVMSIVSNADDPGNVVGTVMTSFHWRTMLLDVLPENSTATMIAVFACPCSQTFSYQFNATSVEYLGTGALHDAKYNDQGKPNIVNVLGTHALRNVTFPARLSADYCPITVTLYPKLELKL